MRKELLETGKSVEEAINIACEKMGLERDSVEWEIIDLPKKGFLGLKNTPAKVKVWIETPDEAPKAKPAPAPRQERAPQPKPQPQQQAPQPASAPAPETKEREAAPQPMIELTGEVAAKAQAAVDYLTGVCKQMGLAPAFTTSVRDGGILIEAEGEGLGALIGRRGETLDSLQYLAGLVANRLEGEYLRLTLDCGGYRAKRKTTLEALARKLSSQVIKTNTSKTLEPMNPFERRIIHATVSEIEGVSSTSVGEEPNRRVIITSPTARPARGPSRGPRRDDHRPGGGRGGDRGPSRGGPRRSGPPRRDDRRGSNQGGTINTVQNAFPSSPSSPSSSAPGGGEPKKTPEANTSDKPLYAKLDLE